VAYRLVKKSELPSLEDRADDELINLEECAAYLGISPATLNNWRTGARGIFGGPKYIPLHDGPRSPISYMIKHVREYLAERTIDPGCKGGGPARRVAA
jgi:predicted DNA-binding transcriptional regulator AlpA